MIWLKRSAIFLAVSLTAIFILDKLFPPPIERGRVVSIMVSDRDDRPLRAIPLDNGTWRFAANLDEIDPVFVGRARGVWRIDHLDADRTAFGTASQSHGRREAR